MEEILINFFNENEPEYADVCIQIAKELIEQSSEEKKKIIKKVGQGTSSRAYQIGDYIIKVGLVKNQSKNETMQLGKKAGYDTKMDIIPNSKYIVQPIIRQYLVDKISACGMTASVKSINEHVEEKDLESVVMQMQKNSQTMYIEVQNLLDMEWQKGKSAEEIIQIIENVFENLLSENLLAYDIYNIGRLIKTNTSHIYYTNENGERVEIKPTEEGIRMTGNVDDNECLQPGDYVLADTEYVEDISQYDEETRNNKISEVRKRIKRIYQDLKDIEDKGDRI